jgi:hypothetical protein
LAKIASNPDIIDRHINAAKRVKKLETTIMGEPAVYALRTQHPDPIAEHLCAVSSMPAGSFPLGQVGSYLMAAELRETDRQVLTSLRLARERLNVNQWVGNFGATPLNDARGNYQISQVFNPLTSEFLGNSYMPKQPPRIVKAIYGEWLYFYLIPGRPKYMNLIWRGSAGQLTGRFFYESWGYINRNSVINEIPDEGLFTDGGNATTQVTLLPYIGGNMLGVPDDAYWYGAPGGAVDRFGVKRGVAIYRNPDGSVNHIAAQEYHSITVGPVDHDIRSGQWSIKDNGFFDYPGGTSGSVAGGAAAYEEAAAHVQQRSIYFKTDDLMSAAPPIRYDKELDNPTTGTPSLGGVNSPAGQNKAFVQTDFPTLQANYWAVVSADPILTAWYSAKLEQAPAGEWLDTTAGLALVSADKQRNGKRITYDHGWQPLALATNTTGRLWYLVRHNFVHLRGWVTSGGQTDGQTITTLPVGARPTKGITYATVAGLTRPLKIVISDGIQTLGWGGLRMARLDGVSFPL